MVSTASEAKRTFQADVLAGNTLLERRDSRNLQLDFEKGTRILNINNAITRLMLLVESSK
jgi:hypothetical protein